MNLCEWIMMINYFLMRNYAAVSLVSGDIENIQQ